MKAERKQIYFLSDVLVPALSLDLKVAFACQLRLLIFCVTGEIASEWQSHCFVSNKYVSQALNNKNELFKTDRLTSFQKAQLQSVSIFFKFVHLFVPLSLLCLSNLL